MISEINIRSMDKNAATTISLADPLECPICKTKFSSKIFTGCYKYYGDDKGVIYTVCYCGECNSGFLTTYDYKTKRLLNSVPKCFIGKQFEEYISNLSPNFVKIYNQALEAENRNLNEIAGIGFRKAVEFLIKDFAIFNNPADRAKIVAMPLSQCVNSYIYDPTIKNLALKTVWLGNDETHYVRKFTDKDTSDLKNFIDATVYFLNMLFVANQAQELGQ